MNKHNLAVLALGVAPGLLYAQGPQDYRCTLGEIERRIEILYESAAAAVPCEVHYYKDTEAPGERQVLWRAYNEAGYCEAKTEAFVAQLREAGFDCGQSVAESPAVTEQPAAIEKEEVVTDQE